jgi:RND family efflux transporter MFP subunit
MTMWRCLHSMAAAIVLTLGACSDSSPPQKMKAVAAAAQQEAYTAAEQEVDDLKAVFATVRSKKVVEARVRTPGTIASLKIVEGVHVEPGEVIGIVADPKIALRIKASDAQIVALESRVATAKADFDRTAELQRRGVSPQARLDQAKTAFDVALNELSAARSERSVIEKQIEEGQILAPARGRVLRVPVTEGSVVMAGESIASIAANEYLLRLELPERHARSIKNGDPVSVGQRGLGPEVQGAGKGQIVQVYPELQNGRVVADAEVANLGDYFVGERTLVWISAGKRKAIVVPRDLVFRRFGLDYVRVQNGTGTPIDVVVQAGQEIMTTSQAVLIEILSGVRPDDKLVKP